MDSKTKIVRYKLYNVNDVSVYYVLMFAMIYF